MRSGKGKLRCNEKLFGNCEVPRDSSVVAVRSVTSARQASVRRRKDRSALQTVLVRASSVADRIRRTELDLGPSVCTVIG
jgi:hypothetical protein